MFDIASEMESCSHPFVSPITKTRFVAAGEAV
jgi:hypothetical protein